MWSFWLVQLVHKWIQFADFQSHTTFWGGDCSRRQYVALEYPGATFLTTTGRWILLQGNIVCVVNCSDMLTWSVRKSKKNLFFFAEKISSPESHREPQRNVQSARFLCGQSKSKSLFALAYMSSSSGSRGVVSGRCSNHLHKIFCSRIC